MPEGPYPYGMEFLAIMEDTVTGNPWGADRVSPLQSGEFEYTVPFSMISGLPTTWDFLKAGHGNIDFLGMPAMLLVDCWPTVWPSATIAQAVLIIEGEFQVSVDHASWGSIKALFR